MLLFDPEQLPKRPRDEAGEAAVRYSRRFIELMQTRAETRRGVEPRSPVLQTEELAGAPGLIYKLLMCLILLLTPIGVTIRI